MIGQLETTYRTNELGFESARKTVDIPTDDESRDLSAKLMDANYRFMTGGLIHSLLLPMIEWASRIAFGAQTSEVFHVHGGRRESGRSRLGKVKISKDVALAQKAYTTTLLHNVVQKKLETHPSLFEDNFGLESAWVVKEMSNARSIQVEARIDEVTKDSFIVTFKNPETGWYSLSIPNEQLLCKPVKNSVLPLDIFFDSERGIVAYSVPFEAMFERLPVIENRPRKLPEEPTDYDDPAQVEAYEKRLSDYFGKA